MRTEEEMLDIILTFAKDHEAIKVVGMEGSRVHPEIKKDALQDYDITYVVSDVQPFIQDEKWLNRFGTRIFMQKPEDMTLFEQQFGNWYSFLMLFEDGIRMISWLVGIETDFSKSVGKSQRFLEQRVSKELWDRIIKTYEMGSYEDLWQALFLVQELFREVSKEVADKLDFDYPDYDENITKYINGLHQEYSV